MRRWIGTLVSAMAAVALVAGPAHAVAPTVQHVNVDDSFPDDSICSFTVGVHLFGTGTNFTYFDAAGNPIRSEFHFDYGEIFSANGEIVRAYGHAIYGADLETGQSSSVGLVQRFTLPDRRTILLDVGRVTFDASGNVTFEAGSHPFLHRDEPEVCAALS